MTTTAPTSTYLGLEYWSTALLAFFLALGPGATLAQSGVLAVSGATLDSTRYEGYKGSPYRFDGDREAVATQTDGARVKVAAVNYNGHTEEFEIVRRDGARVALDPVTYRAVDVIEAGDTLAFVRGLRPREPAKFVRVIYDGADAQLFEAFTVTDGEVVVQNVGKTETYRRFAPRPLYYLALGGSARKLVSLRRKPFVKALSGAANAGELSGVWKATDGDDDRRAAAVLEAYRPK